MSHLVYESYDPFTGITDRVFYEPGTEKSNGKLHFQKLQDTDHILKMNAIQRAENGHKANYSNSDGLHQVARIPNVVIEQWMREGFDWFNSTDAERRRKLNDPEYKKLLVRNGKL